LRKIIYADMDAFCASVDQRDDPTLCGKPVSIAWRGNRSVNLCCFVRGEPLVCVRYARVSGGALAFNLVY
jgi:hypothetical protein